MGFSWKRVGGAIRGGIKGTLKYGTAGGLSPLGGPAGTAVGATAGQAHGAFQGYMNPDGTPAPGAPGQGTRSVYDANQAALMRRLQGMAQGGLPATPNMEHKALAMESGPTGPLPQFDRARQRLSQDANTFVQSGDDALKRRFAAMGGLNSGAMIKQQQVLRDQAEQRKTDAAADIDDRESAMRLQLEEAVKGRNLSREMANQEGAFRTQAFNAENAFRRAGFEFDANSKLAALDLGYKQAENDRLIEEYNRELTEYQKKHSGGLFGSGGFLGLGI